MTLNPLANPKGVKLLCELCQKPAYLECTSCRVTYYCGEEHQRIDWLGIHEKICQLLVPLRTDGPFLPSAEDRQRRDDQLLTRRKELLDLTRTTGQRLLFEGRHEQAVPAAMQSLRFAIAIYGASSIELVPSYLILSESSIGLGRLEHAEEYLAQAQWTVIKTPDCPSAIRSKLQRNLGLLYAARTEYDEALEHFSDDIFHASKEYGTNDIRTAGGYFHMANVFFRQSKMDVSGALYDQVTDMWYKFLYTITSKRITDDSNQKGPLKQEHIPVLDEAQEAEAIQVLSSIFDIREHQPMTSADVRCRITHALAMLYYLIQDVFKAKEYGRKALVLSEKVKDQQLSQSVMDLLKACEKL